MLNTGGIQYRAGWYTVSGRVVEGFEGKDTKLEVAGKPQLTTGRTAIRDRRLYAVKPLCLDVEGSVFGLLLAVYVLDFPAEHIEAHLERVAV